MLVRYLVILNLIYASFSCRDPHKFLYGHWKIYKNTRMQGITSLTTNESEHLVKYLMDKEIILAKDYLIIDGVKYEHPTYKIKEKDADKYLWNYYRIPDDKKRLDIKKGTHKIKVLKIHLPNNINKQTRIELDWKGGGSLLYFDDLICHNNDLILNFEVEFFHLKRIK